jgi:ubiquinone/menaquinone biosynthesis C-methylase UbiE
LRIEAGDIVVDLGCGTGRALPLLRRATGTDGVVVGMDATVEMLHAACAKDRHEHAQLVLADVARLPIVRGRVDAILAAGIVTHVPDPRALLAALARAGAPGCRLAIFHPIGREALARRHQHALEPGELLDPNVLPGVLAGTGWTLGTIDDAGHRYLALASKAD